jgi:signal transduction histidine kinase
MSDAGRRPDTPSEPRPTTDVTRHQVRSFGLIVAIFVALLAIALTASWLAIEIVNITRAYATGEGRYSKAQKIAVLNLHRYAHSLQRSDYDAFLAAIAVPQGDRISRVALEMKNPDLETARAGMLQGENHPDDVDGLIWMFRWFSWWAPFAAAVDDWREGDRLVGELASQGEALHRAITEGQIDPERRAILLETIDQIDHRLTELENTFSTHMGEAARGATKLVVFGLGGTTVLLWAIGIFFATRLFRQQLALDRQLASSEGRFRDYAEVASDWYWETDAELRVVYLSERFFAASSAPAAQDGGLFIGQPTDEIESREHIAALAARRPFRGLRLSYTKADGSTGFWSLAGKPFRDGQGRFLGYRGVGSDVTATVRDAQILRDAKDRAEVANRAKSEFLANMSHELRTPLNAILGFSDIIRRRLFGSAAVDRYVGYAADIHHSGTHLLSIIDDILDLSKIEAGHGELHETDVPLEDIVRATRALFGHRFEQAEIALMIDIPRPSPVLRVDERKLKQILVNLLSNALKFTHRGGRVTLATSVASDGMLSLTVRDTGIGIAAGDIETVLSPFGQVESVFSRERHGKIGRAHV